MPELGHKIRQGIAWGVLARLLGRLSGFLSTIIVVRFLTPEDFGLFAIASIVILFSERLGDVGNGMAIIRHENPGRDEMDTAWTFQLLIGIVIGLGVLVLARPIASFFNEPRVVPLLMVLSIRVALMGAVNIGTVLFRKELRFAKDSQFALYSKIANSATLVVFAVLLQNYWALVIGAVVSRVLIIAISYIMHEYRPRLSLRKIKDIGSYSLWVQISSLAGFFNLRLDQIVLGKISSANALGFYRIGSDLAQMLVNEATSALQQVLLPTYASLQKETKDVKYVFVSSFGIQALYLFAITVGFSFVSLDFIEVVYGEKWGPASQITTWIVYAMSAIAIINSVRAVAMSTGHAKAFAGLQWARLVLLGIVLWWISQETDSALTIAQGRLAAVLLSLPLFVGLIMKLVGIRITQIASVIWRPFLASLTMYGALSLLHPHLADVAQFVRLAVEVISGAIIYCGLISGLWYLFGKGKGPERMMLQQIRQVLKWRHKIRLPRKSSRD